ncbi:class I adenylate-forming enzyme family protein [Microbulbifer sp. SA54]|uniref:class I adenylate-forming enzyme family protein n=1 Tax=Microbulbifer sp. SA54 TaxID=3401577 RepID=UPI003AAD0673
MNRTLVGQLSHFAESLAGHVAISDTLGNELTYCNLWNTASEIARRMDEFRGKIDFAFVMANRGPLQAVAILAALISRTPLALLDIRQGSSRIATMLNQGERVVGIVDTIGEGFLGKIDSLEGLSSVTDYLKVDIGRLDIEAIEFPSAVGSRDDVRTGSCIPSGTALIIYTSGSSGVPKGVCIGGSDLDARAWVEKDWFGLQEGDSVLGVLPVNFDVGLTQLLGTLISGGQYIFSNSWFPSEILAQISARKPCGIAMSPMVWKGLLRIRDKDELWAGINRLRYVTLSGGTLPCEDLREIVENVKNTSFIKTYGQTEMFRIASCKVGSNPADLTSVGAVYPGVEISIVNDLGEPLSIGVEGNIVAAGLGRMIGYVGGESLNPEDTVNTGDLGYMDSTGRLFVSGRKSEMIKIMDQRVFPQDVASSIKAVLNVSDVVVLASSGEDPILSAVVELGGKESLDESTCYSVLRQRLASHMVPKKIYFIREIPTTISGKVDVPALKDFMRIQDEVRKSQKTH